MMLQPIAYEDFYKTGHIFQYPDNTEMVYSNMTARESRIPGIDKIVVFGIQYFIKEYLLKQFNEGFFNIPKSKAVGDYKRRLDNALGKNAVSVKHIEELHDLGYLPICIKALPEGTLCPIRVPFLTIFNTLPKFYWLTNFLETLLSTAVWGMCTSATIANAYRELLDKYAEETSDMPDFVMWQGHDFSMRGMYGLEAAAMSGAAHLLSFTGTDTIPAIDFVEKYYDADSDTELCGGSVAASEHSVMSMGGNESELETYRRLITKVYPKGIVSLVSDTWDYFNVLTNIIPRLKNEIMNRDGKLVLRPDSGSPEKIICGDKDAPKDSPEYKGSVEILWDLFGGAVNSKGYKQLDPHIGLIYGDSITLERAKSISQGLKDKKFASTNIVYGIGSFTYNYVTRDTFGFAVKSTFGVIDGKPVNIFKNPKTDSGVKKSAKGLLRVHWDFSLSEEVSWEDEAKGLLRRVFVNGRLFDDDCFALIKARLSNARKRWPSRPTLSFLPGTENRHPVMKST